MMATRQNGWLIVVLYQSASILIVAYHLDNLCIESNPCSYTLLIGIVLWYFQYDEDGTLEQQHNERIGTSGKMDG